MCVLLESFGIISTAFILRNLDLKAERFTILDRKNSGLGNTSLLPHLFQINGSVFHWNIVSLFLSA